MGIATSTLGSQWGLGKGCSRATWYSITAEDSWHLTMPSDGRSKHPPNAVHGGLTGCMPGAAACRASISTRKGAP